MESMADQAQGTVAENETGDEAIAAPGNGATITLQEYLAASVRAHEAGELETAEEAYETILAKVPDNADALHFLGVLKHQQDNSDEAIELIEKAIEYRPGDAQQHNNLGKVLEGLGRLDEAEEHFHKAVTFDPDYAEAHANLGLVLIKKDEAAEAMACFEAAIKLNPNLPLANKVLGELWLKQYKFEPAVRHLRAYLAQVPDDAQTLSNLGYAVQQLGDFDEAEQIFLKAVDIASESPELRHNLRNILTRKGQGEKAHEQFRQLLMDKPEMWVVEAGFALNLARRGLMDQALETFHDIVECLPGNAVVCNDVAAILVKLHQFEAAVEIYQRAIEIAPELAEAHNGLGTAYIFLEQFELAEAALKRAITIKPDFFEANINLCRTFRNLNDLDQAKIYADNAQELPDFKAQSSHNIRQVYLALCDFESEASLGDIWEVCDDITPDGLSAVFLDLLVYADDKDTVHRFRDLVLRWSAAKEKEAAAVVSLPPRQERGTNEKLRIGFLSSDFFHHSVAKFLMPLMGKYDRDRFEFYCYTPFRRPDDDVQHYFQENVDKFTFIDGLIESDIASLIRQDGVDILFELNGFTRGSSVGALAYKPAPVQMSWLGYPFTSGLKAIDYVVLDRFVKPADETALVEEPLIMPESWICYSGFDDVPVLPGLPMDRNGAITFGTLNSPYKYTEKMMALWAEIMGRVPNSCFLVVRPETKSLNFCSNFTKEFAKRGISSDRLLFINNRAGDEHHLSFYNKIDITLDTFPLTGGTTTCDALWMGVPVVTLVGDAFHQRISYSDLMQCGLEELCTFSPEDFVAKAVSLAGEHDKLLAWRHGLRGVMEASPLCDVDRFIHQFQEMLDQVAELHGLRSDNS